MNISPYFRKPCVCGPLRTEIQLWSNSARLRHDAVDKPHTPWCQFFFPQAYVTIDTLNRLQCSTTQQWYTFVLCLSHSLAAAPALIFCVVQSDHIFPYSSIKGSLLCLHLLWKCPHFSQFGACHCPQSCLSLWHPVAFTPRIMPHCKKIRSATCQEILHFNTLEHPCFGDEANAELSGFLCPKFAWLHNTFSTNAFDASQNESCTPVLFVLCEEVLKVGMKGKK